MEMRFLGNSGLKVSALSFGTATFGGEGTFFKTWGETDTDEARQFVDICLEAGVNLFDTADVYSAGRSEEVLGKAIQGKRDQIILATKAFGQMGEGANNAGLTRYHLIRACEASLRRLNTDYIDLYQAHGWDAHTPLEETLAAFDTLIQQGKVRYVGCSNYSAWHLMRALDIAKYVGGARYVSQQVYYSLVARELEYELVPLALDQQVGILVWSPLTAGFLTGKYTRENRAPDARWSKLQEPPINLPEEQAYAIIETLQALADGYSVSVAQVALNWLLHKPGVTSLVIGARTLSQLKDNLRAVDFALSNSDMQRLNEVSATPDPYPYWHQRKHGVGRNPLASQIAGQDK